MTSHSYISSKDEGAGKMENEPIFSITVGYSGYKEIFDGVSLSAKNKFINWLGDLKNPNPFVFNHDSTEGMSYVFRDMLCLVRIRRRDYHAGA
jgi:hypothetical protein